MFLGPCLCPGFGCGGAAVPVMLSHCLRSPAMSVLGTCSRQPCLSMDVSPSSISLEFVFATRVCCRRVLLPAASGLWALFSLYRPSAPLPRVPPAPLLLASTAPTLQPLSFYHPVCRLCAPRPARGTPCIFTVAQLDTCHLRGVDFDPELLRSSCEMSGCRGILNALLFT